jgi:uncharacterized membrane protein YhaH (DUF805 family)
MFFNLGLFLGTLPIIAFTTGTAAEVNDGAFYVVLTLLFGAGLFLIYAAIKGTEKRITDLAAAAGTVEFWAIIAIFTLSVPIALLIRRWRHNHAADL